MADAHPVAIGRNCNSRVTCQVLVLDSPAEAFIDNGYNGYSCRQSYRKNSRWCPRVAYPLYNLLPVGCIYVATRVPPRGIIPITIRALICTPDCTVGNIGTSLIVSPNLASAFAFFCFLVFLAFSNLLYFAVILYRMSDAHELGLSVTPGMECDLNHVRCRHTRVLCTGASSKTSIVSTSLYWILPQ